MSDNLFRDLKIGLRVLVKEKGFCALAVIVLALGIAGVTTMFSVVNGVALRGFSFPNADRLASVNFVDPTSTTFFGVNGQISAMDFEDLLPQQQSFDALAAYLGGSTVNVTVNGHPQRYTGAYVTETVRSGIASIGPRQMEAARSLGMRFGQMMRLIILPQALRTVIPPLGNLMIAMVKNSAIGATIAHADLLYQAEVLNARTFATFEIFTGILIGFLALTLPLSYVVSQLEHRLRIIR